VAAVSSPTSVGDVVAEEMMVKLFYKPLALLVSVFEGMLAGAIFKQVWKAAAHEDEAPKATEADRGWREILIAAGLQGAIFAVVKGRARSRRGRGYQEADRCLARRAEPGGRG
jgi:hypothetical protein